MRRFFPLLLIPFITGLTSCTTEFKLAREFQSHHPDFMLHLTPPGFLYKYNHKGELIEGFGSLSPAGQDSALFWSSAFVRHVNDSIFQEVYVNSFIDELRNLEFTVYLGHDADSLLLLQPQSYELNIAQLQLDEYLYPYEDQDYFYDTLFYKKFNLAAMDFSVWLELKKIGVSGKPGTVLFSSHMATDDLEGEFLLDPFRQDVKYSYRIDSLEISDLYDIAGLLGKVHASYLYDFFMNQYIAFHYPPNFSPQLYYHYNRLRNNLIPVDDERFDVIEGN